MASKKLEQKKPSKKKEGSLAKARRQLEAALELYEKADKTKKDIFALTMIKAFEVLVEYAWKEIKQRVIDEGLDVFSPKDAVRRAANLGIINEPDLWIQAINARNLSVHDYFSLNNTQYAEMAREFLGLTKKIAG